jgi:hypothetical protein
MSHRVQITLDDRQYEALVVESKSSGASIAAVVRQALNARFQLESTDEGKARFRAALTDAAGLWRDRAEDGMEYQRRIRASLQARRSAAG